MNLYNLYFDYTGINETPIMYHRWAFASITAALIARSVSIPFGHKEIYPCMFVVFVDSPASRKTTAITSYAKPLLVSAGYHYIAADRTSKEKFWSDLERGLLHTDYEDLSEEEDAWEIDDSRIVEAMIICDEMADFMSGTVGEEFAKNLSKMWDLPAPYYTVRTKTAGNARLREPTIQILGACTPAQLTDIFGIKGIGTGFFSRILFIKSPRKRDKVAQPTRLNPQLRDQLVEHLREIQGIRGRAEIHTSAQKILDEIYYQAVRIHDMRLDYYYSRRHEHLLRLCIINALLLHQKPLIDDLVVTYSNTMLYLAETMMPRALGEYGTARAADVSQIVVDAIYKFGQAGIETTSLFQIVSTHVDSMQHYGSILSKLVATGRIQKSQSKGVSRVFPNQQFVSDWPKHLVCYDQMHPEENPYDAGLLR